MSIPTCDCKSPEVVKSQCSGKEYNYCRGCKREVPDGGWPVTIALPSDCNTNTKREAAMNAFLSPNTALPPASTTTFYAPSYYDQQGRYFSDFMIANVDYNTSSITVEDMNTGNFYKITMAEALQHIPVPKSAIYNHYLAGMLFARVNLPSVDKELLAAANKASAGQKKQILRGLSPWVPFSSAPASTSGIAPGGPPTAVKPALCPSCSHSKVTHSVRHDGTSDFRCLICGFTRVIFP